MQYPHTRSVLATAMAGAFFTLAAGTAPASVPVTIETWGYNVSGQLGNGTTTNRISPVIISNISGDVTAVAAGGDDSMAIRSGALYTWGMNANGQLGIGNVTDSSVPVAVPTLSGGVTAIAGGDAFSLAIKSGGVWAWGANGNGQLGLNNKTEQTAPVAITGAMASGVSTIAAGKRHSLAIKSGGVWAWGANGNGQLGDGNTNPALLPVAISTLASGVTDVAAGANFSLALKNGGVWAWGVNGNGQLGNGTATNSSTPIQVDPTDLTNIIDIAAGAHSSYALSSDGSIWAWGDNTFGNLGLGITALNSLVPQRLFAPTGYEFTSVEADQGGYHAIASIVNKPGDANSDGRIDADDYFLIDRGYSAGLTGFGNGDFNGDGRVNGDDYVIIDSAFAAHAAPVNSVSAVPEPAWLGLVGMIILGLLGGRTRRYQFARREFDTVGTL